MIKYDGKYYVWYSRSTLPTLGLVGDIDKNKVYPAIYPKDASFCERYLASAFKEAFH